jgi:hypothetical protein
MKAGFNVALFFCINLHEKDQALLKKVQDYFGGVGKISRSGSNLLQFRVASIKDLQVIISHFDQYPLITEKHADYILFKQAFNLISQKEHLSIDGLKNFVAIKANQNNGLSDELKAAFPHLIPVERPLVQSRKIPDPSLLAGFTSAEGCFYVKIQASKTYSLGFQVQLVFQLTQHSRDEKFMRSLIEYFDCGRVYPNRNTFDFIVKKFSDIQDKIIPFFLKHQIIGVKSKDFEDFCKVVELMKNKKLTKEGLEEIKNIKTGMNTGRK